MFLVLTVGWVWLRDCVLCMRHPRVWVFSMCVAVYRWLVVSDMFVRRVGVAHGLSDYASLAVRTPFSVIQQIYACLGVASKGLVFVDMGSGYGSLLWYTAGVFRVPVIGVEKNPAIAAEATRFLNWAVRVFGLSERSEVVPRLTDLDIPKCVCWVAWTTFSVAERQGVVAELLVLPVGSFVATATYGIGDARFLLYHRFQVRFFWGVGCVYVYERCADRASLTRYRL